MTCAWHETETVPPVTVQVVTTGVAATAGSEVAGFAVVRVAVADGGLVGWVVVEGLSDGSSDASSDADCDAMVDGVGVSVCAADVEAVWVAVAAWRRSDTWGAERMFVDAPSLKTATALHTTKLVTAVASTQEAAAMPAIRRRDVFATRPILTYDAERPG